MLRSQEALEQARTAFEGSRDRQSQLEHRVRELSAVLECYRTTFDVLLGPADRTVTRLHAPDEMAAVGHELAFAGSPAAVSDALHAAYRTLVEVELRGVGYVPGSTSDVLARLAAARLLAPFACADVLAIGSAPATAVTTSRRLGAVEPSRESLWSCP